ncbi:hypothetical protein [Paraflavitalea pollutisoli]|nr:hypothetical protein [Paraflavitalea sp. H1-2-19X]
MAGQSAIEMEAWFAEDIVARSGPQKNSDSIPDLAENKVGG